ncbi:MAG: AMP-binding protein [Cyanobacteria bacterium P01_A01_bin.116]
MAETEMSGPEMSGPEISGPTVAEVWAKLRADWLIESEDMGGGRRWRQLVNDRRHQLNAYVFPTSPNSPTSPTNSPCPHSRLVLIAESNPQHFLASFLAAALSGWHIALANPNWGQQEWESLGQLIAPDVIWGRVLWGTQQGTQHSLKWAENPNSSKVASDCQLGSEPAILIPTGGSTGHVKLVHHTWQSLMSAVCGFRQLFAPDASAINTCCTLPLYHVSGLLQILRAWTSNAQVLITPFKRLETQSPPPLPAFGSHFISLVPTQLHRLLIADKGCWLKQFRAILLGGAPPWPALLTRAMAADLPIYLSYGMTETAAMVTATDMRHTTVVSPSSGKALPHAAVEIVQGGKVVTTGETGQIVVRSHAIAQGYYNQPSPTFAPNTFYTDDLGYLSGDGQLHVVGRASSKIISGGENIFPAEVEAALRSTGQVKDVCVIGLPDETWGEAVAAVYVPASKDVSAQTLKQALVTTPTGTNHGPTLSRYKHPKHWIQQDSLSRNAQGKLNRPRLFRQLTQPASSSATGPLTPGDDEF